MSQGLGADCAFPPAPADWIADLQAFGCQVAFVYVWGPFTRYSTAHMKAAQTAGIVVVPVIVPGNSPPAPPLYAAAWPYGITFGLLFYDIEPFSMPGQQWVQDGIGESDSVGWTAGVYCTAQNRGKYPQGPWWRAGTGWTGGGFSGALPAPAIDLRDYGNPAALQYDFEVVGLSGSRYDLSAVDLDVFTPAHVPVVKPVPAGPPDWLEEEE